MADEGMQGSCFEGGGSPQPKCVLPEQSQPQSGGRAPPAITSGSAIITASYPPHILNRINHLHDKQSINYSFLCGVPLLQLM